MKSKLAQTVRLTAAQAERLRYLKKVWPEFVVSDPPTQRMTSRLYAGGFAQRLRCNGGCYAYRISKTGIAALAERSNP